MPENVLVPLIVHHGRSFSCLEAVRNRRDLAEEAEQNARFALAISDRGYVLDKGVIRYAGSKAKLLANAEIQSRYLSV